MRFSIVGIFSVLLFALAACSGEEQQPPQAPPPKVVQPIKPSTADIEKPTRTLAEAKKPQTEEKVSEDKASAPRENFIAASKPETEEKRAVPEKGEKKEEGTYVVKAGDTLSSIAARKEVLKDPLKWPILLRLNKDNLGEWATGENLPDKELPKGTRLRVMTAREAGANLKKESGPLWVANVLSTPSMAEIVPPAVTLVKEGYPVYIARANVKGQEYMRLRVGFFKNRREADEVGKKIKELLHFQDSWSTKADPAEYEEVAGCFKSLEKH